MRVVSLLPSATEALAFIGAGDLLVGRSHECDHPRTIIDRPVLTAARTHGGSSAQIDAEVRESLSAGQSLYSLDADLLQKLRPDVILTQDLCAVCSIDLGTVRRIAAGLSPTPKIVSLNPHTIEGVLDDLLTIGQAVGRDQSAERAVARLREEMYRLQDYTTAFLDGPSVAVLEWCDPLFIGGHWTPQLVERAGGRHPLNPTAPVPGAGAGEGPIGATQRAAGKSVTVPPEVLAASRPDAVVIAPCGLDLAATRREAAALMAKPWWRDLPAARAGRVALVDGNQFFNRPGPRLVEAYAFLVGWLNDRPEVIPPGFAWEPVGPIV
jgi:ABC-type Fe3+-hydroxamate transport system substrate-binding protein